MGRFAKSYRVPLVGGAAGLFFLVEYQRTRARQAVAAVAATPSALGPGGPDAATAAMLTGGVQLGATTSLEGQKLGQQLGQGGLDLAGLAVSGATGLAAAATGNAAGVATSVAGLAGQLAGILPNLAPPSGYPAQPVTPPPPAPAPGPRPAPAPSFVRYEVVGIGPLTYFSTPSGGTVRRLVFARASSAPAQLVGAGVWRVTGGGLLGYHLIAGRSGSFAVRKVYSGPGGVSYQAASMVTG